MRVFRHFLALALGAAIIHSSGASSSQPAAAAPAPDDRDERTKARARALFEQGLVQLRREEWERALALFLGSRELYRTRGNTQNAALMLARVGRYDEALEMFEALLAEHSDLPDSDRALVREEIGKLARQVARIEISSTELGATVLIDGRLRGTLPLEGALRVAPGSHLISVNKPGSLAFSRVLELKAGELMILDVQLTRIPRGGVMRVTESTGRAADVVVDGVPVGKTPWSGTLPAGNHAVLLRATGQLGTRPIAARVRDGETTVLNLSLEALECSLRVEPVPAAAETWIDGALVGRGVWSGRLGCGEHGVDVAESGFVPRRERVTLRKDAPASIRIELERARRAVLPATWDGTRLVFDLGAGPAVAPTLGGGPARDCEAGCDESVPFGALATLGAQYRLDDAFTLGLELSYLTLTGGVSDRATSLADRSSGAALDGETDDELRLSGPAAGLRMGLSAGGDWSFRFQVGLGVLLGRLEYVRAGRLSDLGERVLRARRSYDARYGYVAPEVRFGPRLGKRAYVSIGVRAQAMVAFAVPDWEYDESPPLSTSSGSRFIAYGSEPLLGRVLVVVSPNVAVEYAF